MRDNPKICHYLDLPLQHISTPILKAMRRGIDREQTIAFVNKVRSFVPDVAFRSTFIVGFPGETDAQFEELCDFIREMRFERAGVLPTLLKKIPLHLNFKMMYRTKLNSLA